MPPSGTLAQRSAGLLEGWGPRVVAITPFVALALFLVTGQWYFFLLIPAMGALVYGGGVGHDGDRDGRHWGSWGSWDHGRDRR